MIDTGMLCVVGRRGNAEGHKLMMTGRTVDPKADIEAAGRLWTSVVGQRSVLELNK